METGPRAHVRRSAGRRVVRAVHPVTPSGGRRQVLLGGARGFAAIVAWAAIRFVARGVKIGRSTASVAGATRSDAMDTGCGVGPALSRDGAGAARSWGRGAFGWTAVRLTAVVSTATPEPASGAAPAGTGGGSAIVRAATRP